MAGDELRRDVEFAQAGFLVAFGGNAAIVFEPVLSAGNDRRPVEPDAHLSSNIAHQGAVVVAAMAVGDD